MEKNREVRGWEFRLHRKVHVGAGIDRCRPGGAGRRNRRFHRKVESKQEALRGVTRWEGNFPSRSNGEAVRRLVNF